LLKTDVPKLSQLKKIGKNKNIAGEISLLFCFLFIFSISIAIKFWTWYHSRPNMKKPLYSRVVKALRPTLGCSVVIFEEVGCTRFCLALCAVWATLEASSYAVEHFSQIRSAARSTIKRRVRIRRHLSGKGRFNQKPDTEFNSDTEAGITSDPRGLEVEMSGVG
jgi:hypothetical protein